MPPVGESRSATSHHLRALNSQGVWLRASTKGELGRTGSPPFPHPTRPPGFHCDVSQQLLGKKRKNKKESRSWCSAQGAPCAGTPTGRGFCLSSPHPSHLLTPGCKSREGQEPAQDPGGSVSGSGGAPGSIIRLGHCGRTQKKRKKTLSSSKGKNPKFHPSLYPIILPHLSIIGDTRHIS